jgi:hypothetical protein
MKSIPKPAMVALYAILFCILCFANVMGQQNDPYFDLVTLNCFHVKTPNVEGYGIDFRAYVNDPQGLGDIESVVLLTPDDIQYDLYDDGNHLDQIANDGCFGNSIQNIPTLSPGIFTFKITDKSGNTKTKTDTVQIILDPPENIIPANNAVISSGFPVFSWNPVPDAVSYSIVVFDKYDYPVWQFNGNNATSVTYNYDNSGTDLIEGESYQWWLSAYRPGSVSQYRYLNFLFSTNLNDPILNNCRVSARHYGKANGEAYFMFSLNTQVADPQGLDDIQSVTVLAPDKELFELENHENGDYGIYTRLDHTPEIGSYVFTVTDKSGNSVSLNDTLKLNLDVPKNLLPEQNAIVTSETPLFSWDPVPFAEFYAIYVRDKDYSVIWQKFNITNNFVTYNDDGNGLPLTDGALYYWEVYAASQDVSSDFFYSSFVYSSEVTGIKLNALANAIVYPNPAREFVTILFEDQKEKDILIQITNIQGEVFFETRKMTANSKIELNMKDLPPGLYFIRINESGVLRTFKIARN